MSARASWFATGAFCPPASPWPVSPPGRRAQALTLFKRGVSSKTLSAVTRQLSTLIGSDIRIEEALRIAAQQTEGQPVATVLNDVRAAILEGRSFAAALGRHPKVFPEFYRASIAAGEQSGKLATVLAHLTEFVGNQEKARRKVQLALLYPAVAGRSVAADDHPDDGLCGARHRSRVRFARCRTALPDARPDRAFGFRPELWRLCPDRAGAGGRRLESLAGDPGQQPPVRRVPAQDPAASPALSSI
jgi:hypothetical protein